MKLTKILDAKLKIGVTQCDDGRFYAGFLKDDGSPDNKNPSLYHRTVEDAIQSGQDIVKTYKKLRKKQL